MLYKSTSQFVQFIIDNIGFDTYVYISTIMWIFVIYNFIRKGTRF